MKDIAAMTGTSVSGVSRCLNLVSAMRPAQLPEVLSFDEFKGDTNGERFHSIITDPKNRRIFDILPTRNARDIQEYLRQFDNRDKVKYVVIDMNRGYRDVAKTFLPCAKIVIDRFHVVRYCTWAMDDVRRRVQKALPPEKRRYFKRSRRLLLARRSRLSDEDRAAVDVILYHSEDLIRAYALKELFFQFMDSHSRHQAALVLDEWMDAADRLMLPEFKACRNMLSSWKPYILNAFDVPYSNGFTEGCNNASKVLKRLAFGFRCFANFRKRILLAAPSYPYI
jgi:transposase